MKLGKDQKSIQRNDSNVRVASLEKRCRRHEGTVTMKVKQNLN